jgi:uncharacterized protein with FMN-binding domain
MRRVVISIVGTIAGLGALLSFKTHTGTSPLSAAGPLAGTPVSTVPAPPSGAVPSSSGSASAGSASSGSASSATPAPATSTAPAQRTVAGQAVVTRYGTVQVQVVVSGTSIQSVSFLQLTADDPRSQDINSQAAPILVQQTMQAQSAQIDGVSGATYTSQGYQQSLQSALDQAGIK